MGVLVEGRAQVSMNLTNFRQTPVARVVEIIRREAERYGTAIHHSELVGLIPQEALNDAAVWHLQLDGFEPSQVLETRLMELMREQPAAATPRPEVTFIDALASAEPTPGGGSAGAHTGAVAAALVAMVCRVTVSKKKYEGVKDRMWAILEQAETLRSQLSEAVEKDAAAFNEVMNAFKLPKDTPEQEEIRRAAVQAATHAAARAPLEAAKAALAVQELAVEAAEIGNLNAISDAASGATLARASLLCSAYNVRINTLSLEDPNAVAGLIGPLRELEVRSAVLDERLRRLLSERGGIKLD
jgi:glutamate formiminotransferase/formiminotetrahydrofolate cyclodeaminase